MHLKKIMAISHDRGGYWKHMTFYITYSKTLHKVGKHKEEKDIYKIYQNLFPDNEEILGKYGHLLFISGRYNKSK